MKRFGRPRGLIALVLVLSASCLGQNRVSSCQITLSSSERKANIRGQILRKMLASSRNDDASYEDINLWERLIVEQERMRCDSLDLYDAAEKTVEVDKWDLNETDIDFIKLLFDFLTVEEGRFRAAQKGRRALLAFDMRESKQIELRIEVFLLSSLQ